MSHVSFLALMIDLLTHYDTLVPPTIQRKKRESERKLPFRKRTAPTDMRLSRSKISIGADATQLLAAQQIAQNPSLASKNVKSPELPPQPLSAPTTPLPVPQQVTAVPTGLSVPPPPPPPAVYHQMKTPPPPPPLVGQPVPPPPPAPASVALVPPPPPHSLANQPPTRPFFKDPPPELDDFPPRPSFKDPPPELDDFPPRPTFVDPGPEDSDAPSSSSLPPPPSTRVIPPTPQKAIDRSGAASPRKLASRSPTPPNAGSEDLVLGAGKSSISRGGTGQSSGASRMPRGTRPARPLSGNVQSLVQNLNRTTMNTSPGPTNPRRFSGSSGTGSPVRRPSSIVGRNATSFSRRTMASDAEDDLVDRK